MDIRSGDGYPMLSDAQVRNAKAKETSYRLADAEGLFLFVTAKGAKVWRHRYFFDGRERVLSLGPYPHVSLADARKMRDEQRQVLHSGRDPATVPRVVVTAAPTFEEVAREWHTLSVPQWVPRHAADVLHSLEQWVFPEIGGAAVRALTAPEVLAVLRKIEGRGAIETARRVRQRISAVFVFAIGSGRADTDPAAIVEGALAPLPPKGRQPAARTLDEAREILARCEAETAHPVTKLAMRLLAITAIRPGTLGDTPWVEFADLDAQEPVWRIPAARMKLRAKYKADDAHDHLVPLPPQAVEVIDVARDLTARGPFVFPNARHAHKPMSENALGYLLNRAGYHGRHVPHGWRATFSTVMNERHPGDSKVIDLMLAHAPQNAVEAAYNRAAHFARRRELAAEWAALLLDGMAPAAELLRGRRR